jgi:hypothetical protein
VVPCVTHLLMGYDVGADPSAIERGVLLPRPQHSCLYVVLEALQKDGFSLAAAKPEQYAQCLQLLYELAASPASSAPMLHLLSPASGGGALLADLCEVLVSELPPPDPETAHELTARLRQKACLLQLQALQLLRAERPEAVQPLIEALLQPASGQPALAAFGAGGPGGAGQSVLLAVLDEAASLQVTLRPRAAAAPPCSTPPWPWLLLRSSPAALEPARAGDLICGSAAASSLHLRLRRPPHDNHHATSQIPHSHPSPPGCHALQISEPSTSDVSGEQHRLLQEMSVDDVSADALLTNLAVMQQLGVVLPSGGVVPGGEQQLVFAFEVLQPLMQERYVGGGS